MIKKMKKIKVLWLFLIIVSINNFAQEKLDSLKFDRPLNFDSFSYLDYKLKEFITPNYNSINSIHLISMESNNIQTGSLSDLNYALSMQYEFNYNDDLSTFKSILGGIGAAAAVTIGAIHLKKYGGEYFKRKKKD